jgi:Pyruvate/2-oxoacid:ferredoxin oxidoreductase delta subunit
MPAIREEVEEAIEEGVKLHELLAPIALVPTADRLSLRCQRMRLGELDASGRRSPTPCEGPDSFVELVCERVVLALGQVGDLAIFPEGSEIRDGRALVGLSEAPVFAGGDLVGNEGTVAAAIAAGRRAAWHIHRTLSGEDLFPRAVEPVVSLSALRFTRFQKTPQRASQRRASPSRLSSFEEVRLGLQDLSDHAEAWDESLRCLSCGSCTQCDVCRENCPEGILARRGDEYAFNYDYCKGCGLCAAECPRGVVYMEQL